MNIESKEELSFDESHIKNLSHSFVDSYDEIEERKIDAVLEKSLGYFAYQRFRENGKINDLLKQKILLNQMKANALKGISSHEHYVNDNDTKGFTPLHLAALQGKLPACCELLKLNADPNQATKSGMTPLHIAVFKRNRPLILLLLHAGADISIKDDSGFNPLHYAVSINDLDLVDFLLRHGAKKVISDIGGEFITPLSIASFKGLGRMEELLKREGAQESKFEEVFEKKMLAHAWGLGGVSRVGDKLVNLEGSWPELTCLVLESSLRSFILKLKREEKVEYLYQGMHSQYKESFAEKYAEIYERLLYTVSHSMRSKHSDSHKVAEEVLSGKSMMIHTGWEGHMTSVVFCKIGEQYFLIKCNRGAGKRGDAITFYSIKNTDAQSLSYAINALRKEQRQFFTKEIDETLELKACFSIPQKDQKVGNCTWANLKSGVRALIAVDLLQKSVERFPNIMLDNKRFLEREKDYIIQKSRKIYKRWSISIRQDRLEHFLKYTQNKEESALLLYEVWKKSQTKGLKESVENIFAENNFQLSKAVASKNLFLAVESGDLSLVKMYLDFGVNVNQSNGNAETALHLAAYYGYRDLVEFLMEKGAKVDAKDYQGSTPLHLAAYQGHTSVINALCQESSD